MAVSSVYCKGDVVQMYAQDPQVQLRCSALDESPRLYCFRICGLPHLGQVDAVSVGIFMIFSLFSMGLNRMVISIYVKSNTV